jgi:predicted permease
MRDEPIIPTRSRQKIASENRVELEGWIAERAAELVKEGLQPDDARRRALEEFGDVAAAERYAGQQDVAADRLVRATFWIEEFTQDLRIALRTLARTPSVTAVVLLTFALGVGATTAVFSVVHAMLLRELPYGNEESLVWLPALDDGVIRPGLGGARHSAAAVIALRERTTSFSGVAAISMGNTTLTLDDEREQVWIGSMTPDAFDVLQARAAIGRTFAESDVSEAGGSVVVLLDGIWRRRYGADSAIVGRTIEMDAEPHRVIGIMPPGFHLPTYEQAELLEPQILTSILRNANSSQVRAFRLFGRMKPGVSTQVAQADIDRAMRTLRSESPTAYVGLDARVVPIRTAVAGDARPRILVLMGAAAFVLLIACANVAGVLLARAVARRHELSVRVALGAARRRLVRQFLAEGAVLAIAGAVLGVTVGQLGIVALRTLAATALPAGTAFALEPNVLLFGIAAAIAGAFASSLVPALGATRVPGIALRSDNGRASASRSNRRLRLGLVAGQLAVSVVLLVGAGLFLRVLHGLSTLDLGYRTEGALTFRPRFSKPQSNVEQDAYYASLYAQLRAIPGVISVGGGNIPTTGQSSVAGVAIEGRPVEDRRLPDARYTPVSDDYFAALGIAIIRGRAFSAQDVDGAPSVAVVSERLARQLWPGGDPIGARVRPEANKPWSTVVGIVGDVRMGGADTAQPSLYTSQRQDHWPGAGAVVIRSEGDPRRLIPSVRQAVKRVDPTLFITDMKTLEDFRRGTPAIAERRMLLQLIMVFALVALAVSAIGVYGVSAYATEARRREFGIRMALGASGRGVLWLALKDGAHVALLGVMLGIPLALLLASSIRSLLYSVAPFDPLTIGSVLAALFLVVFAASLVPARRATLIDPARTMRTD